MWPFKAKTVLRILPDATMIAWHVRGFRALRWGHVSTLLQHYLASQTVHCISACLWTCSRPLAWHHQITGTMNTISVFSCRLEEVVVGLWQLKFLDLRSSPAVDRTLSRGSMKHAAVRASLVIVLVFCSHFWDSRVTTQWPLVTARMFSSHLVFRLLMCRIAEASVAAKSSTVLWRPCRGHGSCSERYSHSQQLLAWRTDQAAGQIWFAANSLHTCTWNSSDPAQRGDWWYVVKEDMFTGRPIDALVSEVGSFSVYFKGMALMRSRFFRRSTLYRRVWFWAPWTRLRKTNYRPFPDLPVTRSFSS
jgi:hypothetical protein